LVVVCVLLGIPACGGDAVSTVPEVSSTVREVSSTVREVSSTVPEATSTTSAEVGSVVGTWGLDSITVDGQPMALSPDLKTYEYPDVAAWIRFDEAGLVNGRLTCNGFMGEYDQLGSLIEWEVVQEAAACSEPDGVMEAEAPMSDLIFTLTIDAMLDEDAGKLQLAGSNVEMAFSRLDD
jgi:heat shock protein HslJ